jgi:hypothetical protein
MQCINSKWSEKERIGAIDQGFTCLAARTAQNLVLVDLEDYPTMARLINDAENKQTSHTAKRPL